MTKTKQQKAARRSARESKRSTAPVVERKTTTTTVAIPRVKGKGDYKILPGLTLPNKDPGLAKLGGESWGRRIGNMFGAGDVGNAIHSGIKSIFGWGDYRIRNGRHNSKMQSLNHPTDVDQILGGDPAMFGGGGVPSIKHREFLGLIHSSQSFTKTEYAINPGMSATFPWLNGIAKNFTKYRVDGMVVEFKSRIGNAVSGTGALGAVIIGTQYDPTEAPFSNELGMANNEFTVSEKPSENFYHLIECDPAMGNSLLCVREGPPANSADLRLYDKGRLTIATTGQINNGDIIGELWISYKISFIIPMLPSVSAPAPTSFFSFGRIAASTQVSVPMGYDHLLSYVNTYGQIVARPWDLGNLKPVMDINSTSSWTMQTTSLPVGKYVIMYETWQGYPLLCSTDTYTIQCAGVVPNTELFNGWSAITGQTFANGIPSAYTGSYPIQFAFTKLDNAPGSVTFTWSESFVSGNQHDKVDGLWLFQYSSGVSEEPVDRMANLENSLRLLTKQFAEQKLDIVSSATNLRHLSDDEFIDLDEKKVPGEEMVKSMYLSKSAVAKLLGR